MLFVDQINFSDVSEKDSSINVSQQIIEFDQDSRQLLNEFAEEIVKRQNVLEKDNLEPLLSRSRKSYALSTICALASNVDTKKIEQSHTKWAIDYVRYYDLLFIETCRDKVSSSATEAKIKSVLSYIRSRGRGIRNVRLIA